MSIGKSSIKRVENNGYSRVKSEAPDMEDSVVVEEAPAPAMKKRTAAPRMEKKEPREGGVRKHSGATGAREEAKASADKPDAPAARKPRAKSKPDSAVKNAPTPEETESAAAPEETPVAETATVERQSATEYFNVCRGKMPIHLL